MKISGVDLQLFLVRFGAFMVETDCLCRLHRTFHFILTNGLGPLFEGYATSLDLLVNTAWISIEELRRGENSGGIVKLNINIVLHIAGFLC